MTNLTHSLPHQWVPIRTRCSLNLNWWLPSDIWSDFKEGASERYISAGLRSVRQWGAFLGAGDSLGVLLSEDTLRASSDSTSVRPASSLELDSGLLIHTVLLSPFETCDGVRWRTDLSLPWAERAVLVELFCSEEWEDKDSMLPMGVLLGLLLKVSPMQGPEKRHIRPSLKPAQRVRDRACITDSSFLWKDNIQMKGLNAFPFVSSWKKRVRKMSQKHGKTLHTDGCYILKGHKGLWGNCGVMACRDHHCFDTHSLRLPGTVLGCRDCGASWAL